MVKTWTAILSVAVLAVAALIVAGPAMNATDGDIQGAPPVWAAPTTLDSADCSKDSTTTAFVEDLRIRRSAAIRSQAETSSQPLFEDRIQTSVQYNDCQNIASDWSWSGHWNHYVTRANALADKDIATRTEGDYTNQLGERLLVAFVEVDSVSDYDQLNLDRSWNCIYLGLDGTIWRAAARPCDPRDTVPPPSTDTLDNDLLAVKRLTYRDRFAFEDYPPVVRWHWDSRNKEQALGVKCGAGWCVIGRKDNLRIDTTSYDTSAQGTIAGWRDEQYLMKKNGKIGDVMAVIVPGPALIGKNEPSDFEGTNVPAAMVYLNHRSELYRRKLGLEKVDDVRSPNRIFINYDPSQPDSLRWTAKVVPYGPQDTVRLRIELDMHAGTIGTGRWFWLSTDEDAWIGCGVGCCRMKGKGDEK